MMTTDPPTLWWHVYGGITTKKCSWGEGHWAMMIMGESTMTPEAAAEVKMPGKDWTPSYLTSFDHSPTDAERIALTPEEYRDEEDQ